MASLIGTNQSTTTAENDIIPMKVFIPLLTFMVIECLLIIVFNLVVIIVMVKRNEMFSHCRCLVISLAVMDLLVGAISGPMLIPWNQRVPSMSKPIENKWIFYLYVAIPAGFSQLSLLHLAAISLERVYATFFPFSYRNNIKKQVNYIVIAIIWIADILGNVVIFAVHEKTIERDQELTRGLARQTLLTAPCFFSLLCLFTVGFSYLSIFLRINVGFHAPQQRPKKEERRITVTLFLVTLCSFLTWFPLLIYFLVLLSNSTSESDYLLISVLRYLAGLNSLVNPLLYFFRVKEFKKTIMNFIQRKNEAEQVPTAVEI